MDAKVKDAWGEAGRSFSAWGRTVADNYRSRGRSGGEDAEREERRKLEEAFETVRRQLDQTFSALGDSLRDAEASANLHHAVDALGAALTVTFSEVRDGIRGQGSSPKPPSPKPGADSD